MNQSLHNMFVCSNIRIIILITSFLVTLCIGKSTVQEYSNRNWHTGTMTPYFAMADLKVNKSEIEYPGYRPIKIWFVGRHGPRYPADKILSGMFTTLLKVKEEVLKHGEGNPCYSEELRTWEPQSNLELDDGQKIWREDTDTSKIAAQLTTRPKDEHKIELPIYLKTLSSQGRETMRLIGLRFRERFDGIIPTKLDSKTEITSSKALRARESATSFAHGLFGEHPSKDCPYIRKPEKSNKILKFDSACFYWKLMVKNKTAITKMFKDYAGGPEMSNMLMEVKERCSLKTLDQKTLMLIYTTCSYELGWYDESPWCNFLLEHHLQVLEYVEDLKLYNHCAYGDEMNYRIACPLFNDMFNFFKNQNETFFRFSFSHSKTLLKFSAHLGLFKTKEGLRADNFKDKNEREWASSRFGGFGFNFTFILYESINNTNERAVLLMLNERRIKIPRCETNEDTYLCPWEIFEKIFEDSIYKCHYDEWCKNEEYEPLYEKYLSMRKDKSDDSEKIISTLQTDFLVTSHSNLSNRNHEIV